MNKSFKIARKPGQAPVNTGGEGTAVKSAPAKQASKKKSPAQEPVKPLDLGATTRKTIEVPEGYFWMVKTRALNRRMKEKELWAEILGEYFKNHPGL